MYCEECGKRIAETAKFCPYCGHSVGIADSVQPQQSVKQAESTLASLETRQESTPISLEPKQEQTYVGFWARFAANFLDGILISIFVSPASIYIGHLVSRDRFWGYYGIRESGAGALAFYSVLYVLSQVILLVLWSKKQASIGKMAIAAKIVDAKTGKAPTKKQLIGRYFAYLLSFLPLCLGFLWIAFDSKKQGWHDKLAGTAVIYV